MSEHPSDEQPDHYFTAQPASDGELRRTSVRLAGQDVEVVTAGGIFSPDGIDKGTRVLLDEAPAPPGSGTFLDLGCGWGPLALTMALESPAATVHAVDVNERALDLCRRNAEALGCAATGDGPGVSVGRPEVSVDRPGVSASRPEDVDPTTTYDLIWSNPPIRVGKAVLHELMTTWLPRLTPATDGRPGGTAYLVVQKNLGSDSLQAWLQATLPDLMAPDTVEVTRAASSKGFRILRVTRS
ncbi:class I SAM-dependent methyltransferase [Ornithinimicrobium panacihumi]|uniref:class I SAM-dependent methyltransferase n=1 Tax=Ornithinimicrobium panacihumi TaxID=2008449 RepID=UPI003F894D1C